MVHTPSLHENAYETPTQGYSLYGLVHFQRIPGKNACHHTRCIWNALYFPSSRFDFLSSESRNNDHSIHIKNYPGNQDKQENYTNNNTFTAFIRFRKFWCSPLGGSPLGSPLDSPLGGSIFSSKWLNFSLTSCLTCYGFISANLFC